MGNADQSTLQAFDAKWSNRWKGRSDAAHDLRIFQSFFSLFPFAELTKGEGFDLGCGVGRHAAMVAPRVSKIHCIDPSPNAVAAAREALAGQDNAEFHLADVDHIPLADRSQDFGFSMGVLHHIPDTEAALRHCVAKLKPGAPFLLYLYYRFDDRPLWFRMIWKASDVARRLICRLPIRSRKWATDALAVGVYWPLSRLALLLERSGRNVANLPLSFYRRTPMRGLKVSSYDRLATPLEQRFTRPEIERMMLRSGLTDIRFQEHEPYWVALGRRG